MMMRQYHMAHDCPHCGCKDAVDEWGGARMMSSEWGHDFSCCSDACGKAFAVKYKQLVKTRQGRKELASLWAKLAERSDAWLTGEPYPGYKAEQQLKHRRFD